MWYISNILAIINLERKIVSLVSLYIFDLNLSIQGYAPTPYKGNGQYPYKGVHHYPYIGIKRREQ